MQSRHNRGTLVATLVNNGIGPDVTPRDGTVNAFFELVNYCPPN